MLKKISFVFFILFVLSLAWAAQKFYPMLSVATGYAAKKMCSCHFVAGRTAESIQKEDLVISPLNLTHTVIDPVGFKVSTTLFGMAAQTAVYKENLGCVLLQGKDDYHVSLKLPHDPDTQGLEWPLGEKRNKQAVQGVDYKALDQAIEGVFDPSLEMDHIKTRAVVVVYKDTLIAEKYAQGFDKDTEILGWSMTKSIVSTLIGVLAKEGKLSLTDDHLIDYWTDNRSAITLKDLLQMQSGLSFEENYTTVSDATEMLYKSEDIVNRAARLPLVHPIGSHWSYSSGTSNIVSGILRNQFDRHEDYLRFPHDQLFDPLGMHSAVMEIDESGNYIGSSYCYATPSDWAKFGLLYLNEGNWNGQQIIDTSWVNFSQTAASNSEGRYGGHFWLNKDHVRFKDVPADLYSANGYQGQFVYIIPSKDLVVVRMGLNSGEAYDANVFLQSVISAVDGE